MQHQKAGIKALVNEGQLESAIELALGYAEQCHLPDIANELSTLSARARNHHHNWSSGLISYEDYSLAHAQLTHGLLQWVERLPDTPRPAGPRRKFVTEEAFKKRVFYLLLFIKAVVFVRLSYHASTGGFNADQFQGTAALLMPAMGAYVAVMLADFLRQHRSGPQAPRYVSGPLVTFAYWLFPIYACLLILFMELKAKGNLSFTGMNTWLALVESVLGGYIGQVVHGLFKRTD